MNNVIITKKGLNIPYEKISYIDLQEAHITVHLSGGGSVTIREIDVDMPLQQIVESYNGYYGKKKILCD